MQVNLDCKNSHPQFGAFHVKGAKLAKIAGTGEYKFFRGDNVFFNYVNGESAVVRRGFEQYKKEQEKLNLYDVVFDWTTNAMEVVEKSSSRVIETFRESPKDVTGLNHFGIIKFPGMKLFARLFDPKRFLPYNMILAGEKAKSLEKEVIAHDKAINKLLNI